ncbi:hypothetical protein RIF29_33233 [Crotalaria pallida]|uniref:Uncharacterized protein n=1 Tax=Crotalaria pallida TaxID=3830 RepID=A0AAN9E7X8_CROPI
MFNIQIFPFVLTLMSVLEYIALPRHFLPFVSLLSFNCFCREIVMVITTRSDLSPVTYFLLYSFWREYGQGFFSDSGGV